MVVLACVHFLKNQQTKMANNTDLYEYPVPTVTDN